MKLLRKIKDAIIFPIETLIVWIWESENGGI